MKKFGDSDKSYEKTRRENVESDRYGEDTAEGLDSLGMDRDDVYRDDDRSIRDEGSSLRDDDRSTRDEGSSLRDDDRSFGDDERSLRDDDRPLRDDDRSLRDDNRLIRDDDRSLRDDDRPLRDDDRPLLGRESHDTEMTGMADDARMPIFPTADAERFRTRWMEIQTDFVDEPRRSVEHADELVSEVTERLTSIFKENRGDLERQWTAGDEVSTEDLRRTLQRYRSFFERLLTV